MPVDPLDAHSVAESLTRLRLVPRPATPETHAVAVATGFDDPSATLLNGYVDGAGEPAATAACVMGEPVYRRMGFATVRLYHRYDLP